MREKRSVPRAPELEGWRPRAQVRESFYIFSGWFGGEVATPVNLGFLGASRFGRENPHKSLLDFLGFPWILSSESRLINGLHAIFAERIFPRAFPLSFEAREREPTVEVHAEAQDCSWGKLNSISDYPQELVGSSRLGSKPERLYSGDRLGLLLPLLGPNGNFCFGVESGPTDWVLTLKLPGDERDDLSHDSRSRLIHRRRDICRVG